MLFKIDKNKSVFETNPELRNIPEFAELNEKQMRYVMWYADWKSPYRSHPDLERKRLCAIEAGWSVMKTHDKTLEPIAREVMNGLNIKVNEAIEKYRTLAPNEDRELLLLYAEQIANIKEAVKAKPTDPGELKKLNDLLMTLPELRKSQLLLAKTAGMEDELGSVEDEVKETRKMSTIDRYHAQQLAKAKES